MFVLTCYGWLLFRASSLDQIVAMTIPDVARQEWSPPIPGRLYPWSLLLRLFTRTVPLTLPHGPEGRSTGPRPDPPQESRDKVPSGLDSTPRRLRTLSLSK